MKIIDTMVIIPSLDQNHPLHRDALKHLTAVSYSKDIYIPSAVLLESDLVMKNNRIPKKDRAELFEKLSLIIPKNKVLPITATILRKTVELEENKNYFDALIASTALEYNSEIISKDPFFSKQGIKTTW
ncbi:MAG: type II toxin-antitoxin system VapC family toxin [Candidatus Jordarchaeum sp.]|uniref:type II toxin-antitoxin system VapC family toxin n=1 Tax=Candidatus Jordarchaeum sp. TaxID=2823881 RepID=UPI00404A0990